MDTTKFNRNFKIKIAGSFDGVRLNTLVRVSGLVQIVGYAQAKKLMRRAEKCVDDKCVCKLRRGIKVTFYVD